MPYLFHRGRSADLPLILPLVPDRVAMRRTVEFCRTICRGAPMLVPNPAILAAPDDARRFTVSADRVAALLTKATRVHGLTLVPIIAVGHGAGAEVAAQLALSHSSQLSACVLLRPRTATTGAIPGVATGLHVLLLLTRDQDVAGMAGRQIQDALTLAGASVVFERARKRETLDARDAGIARVFIAALFGA